MQKQVIYLTKELFTLLFSILSRQFMDNRRYKYILLCSYILLFGCKTNKVTTTNKSITYFNRTFIKNSVEMICFDNQAIVCDFKDTILLDGLKIHNSNIVKEEKYYSPKKCFKIIPKDNFINLNFIDSILEDTILILKGNVMDKKPEIYILADKQYYSGDTININTFNKAMKLNIEIMDLNFDFQIKINSFKLIYYKNKLKNEIMMTSSVFNQEIREKLLNADKKSFIIIKDFKHEYNPIQKYGFIPPYLLYLK